MGSEKEVSAFRAPFGGFGMTIGDPFLLMESHIPRMHCIELRATCSVSCMDTPTCQTLHVGATFDCSCLPTFILSSLLFEEGGTAPNSSFAARIHLALFCRAVQEKLASRREEYTTRGGAPRTREKFFEAYFSRLRG